MNPPCVYVYPLPLQSPSHPASAPQGHHIALSWASCYSSFPLVVCLASDLHMVVYYMSVPLSQFVPLFPPLTPCPQVYSLHLCSVPALQIKFTSTIFLDSMYMCRGFPSGSVGKKSTCNAGDTGNAGLTPGLGRSPGGGNGKPLQHYHLKIPMDRGARRATVHRLTKRRTL